ncbi:MAG TPA: P-type conjugative transfer protein TrbG, partial [Pararhizobium sp.]|nr:P-type conjugative transfer protein TrbG [Pararhizobium sp.]
MKSSFRKAADPASRQIAFGLVLLSATALAGCATPHKPPEIAYDNAMPAVKTVDPPGPVRVVELPKPLPLPGQLKPVETSTRKPEAADPKQRVKNANTAARVQPIRDGFINAMQVYPFSKGALYQVYAAV